MEPISTESILLQKDLNGLDGREAEGRVAVARRLRPFGPRSGNFEAGTIGGEPRTSYGNAECHLSI